MPALAALGYRALHVALAGPSLSRAHLHPKVEAQEAFGSGVDVAPSARLAAAVADGEPGHQHEDRQRQQPGHRAETADQQVDLLGMMRRRGRPEQDPAAHARSLRNCQIRTISPSTVRMAATFNIFSIDAV